MKAGNPYEKTPLSTLKHLRELKVENIGRERRDLEMIELAIKDAEHPSMGGLLTQQENTQLLASGGNVRDIVSWARKILRAKGHIMAASDIADVMYSYAWAIELKAFRRRVIVAVSYVANLEDRNARTIWVSGYKADNREVLWALPEWMDGDRVRNEYLKREIKAENDNTKNAEAAR